MMKSHKWDAKEEISSMRPTKDEISRDIKDDNSQTRFITDQILNVTAKDQISTKFRSHKWLTNVCPKLYPLKRWRNLWQVTNEDNTLPAQYTTDNTRPKTRRETDWSPTRSCKLPRKQQCILGHSHIQARNLVNTYRWLSHFLTQTASDTIHRIGWESVYVCVCVCVLYVCICICI